MFGFLSLILILTLIVPISCVARRTTADSSNSASTDTERITTLESKVSQLQAKIASLPQADSTDYSGDIEQLQGQMDDLQTQLDDILTGVDEKLASFEEEQQAVEEQTASAATTRWTMDMALGGTYSDNLTVDSYYSTPSRIEEDDTYRIGITLVNTGPEVKGVYVIVYLVPKTKDTSVNTVYTAMDSSRSPYLEWWSDFRPTPSSGSESSVNCRRIEFTSDEFNVPAAGTVATTVTILAELDLVYAD